MDDSHRDDSAAILVGRLIRSYRDDARSGGRRLSQDGLIDLMVERGEDYATNLDRSSVSRWESGARLAPREFLVAFGRSLRVPQPEIDRMLSLAGYESLGEEEGWAAMLAAQQSLGSQVENIQRDVRSLMDSAGRDEPQVDAYGVAKEALRRLAPAGIYALVVGFVLNEMGLNGTLALLTYALVASAIVIGQGALRWLNRNNGRAEHDHVVDLFFISLFFTLNGALLISALTKADHFGFYTIEAYTNTPMPFLLTILANLALSLAASIMFSVLWRRRQGSHRGGRAFERAVWATLPPILFAYFSVSTFTNLGSWIFYVVVFGILFGAFTTIVALNEPDASLGDASFVFKAAIGVITVLCSFGVLGTLAAYVNTDMALTAASIRIVPLREISAEQLGYTPEEGVKLLRLGMLWMSLANIVYLVTVVGGYLLVTIRRVRRTETAPAASPSA